MTIAEIQARVSQRKRAAREIAAQGERPIVFDCSDKSTALIARHPADKQWRLFLFDAEHNPIGDYGVGFYQGACRFEGLVYAALTEFGADLASVRNAGEEF